MTLEVEAAAQQAAELIRTLAAEFGDGSYEHTIWKAAKFYLRVRAGAPREADTGPKWSARVMLFDPNDDLVADSQPDADMDAQPSESLPTLRHIGRWAADSAAAYHAGLSQPPPEGLDDATLERRMLAARVAIHRHKGGLAWWKLPYTVGDQLWHAHIRLGRLTNAEAAAAARPRQPMRGATVRRAGLPPSLAPGS